MFICLYRYLCIIKMFNYFKYFKISHLDSFFYAPIVFIFSILLIETLFIFNINKYAMNSPIL